MAWIDVAAADELAAAKKLVVRHEGRQILLLETAAGLFACVNRCPHEGYPLREGSLSGDAGTCVLTCNWHNWKFDLMSGETLVGGDKLRRFPIRRTDTRIEIDITADDATARRATILAGIEKALYDDDAQRQSREIARLMRLKLDPLDAVRQALIWASDRLEFGTTHAIGAAPDWLTLARDVPAEDCLVALGEILAHLSDDARDRTRYPFAAGTADWDEAKFAAAVEAQDEAVALRLMRGGLARPLSTDIWRRVLTKIALAHYADFGHALIYAVKSMDLVDLLGPAVAEPLLSPYVRALCYSTREDLLPEFRSYAAELARWGQADSGPASIGIDMLRRGSAKSAMALVRGWSATAGRQVIWPALLETAAWQLLHADEARFWSVDQRLSENANWLDLTHTLTFADAGWQAATLSPELWPAIQLQLACFVGRNTAFVDPECDVAHYRVEDPGLFWREARLGLLDHGRGRFIISAHLTKTLMAAERLASGQPHLAPLLASALNRFLKAPIKERHTRRTARQMLDLVAQE
ncbi:Rieske (2Fe-2S) protein [Dongia rigui]|uniref:Rieske 2Fe-2S domain-containing protein n=1 Tax=Dongia rigui TaxID=940149 RepID=A0ABU5DXH7_9PROT|nr:Rieske 2Fe-2S domain-containing protein [Dongia rigui]MDY0871413.1 Rieske 2Fe-2S domain-containing protein [Dongia rigui]